MKILIISLPRTGSTSLLFKMADEYNVRPIFEPFHDGTNTFYNGETIWTYNKNENNVIVKTIVHHHPNNLELVKEFNIIILLSRRNLKECAESNAYFAKQVNSAKEIILKNNNEYKSGYKSYTPYFYDNISQREFETSFNFILKLDSELKKLSELLKIPITYYEDIFDVNSKDRLRKNKSKDVPKHKLF